jgi:2-polyprenyl-3-methyl-5-hydroxy-6-metoxy-1,4-benzoquinol methylase
VGDDQDAQAVLAGAGSGRLRQAVLLNGAIIRWTRPTAMSTSDYRRDLVDRYASTHAAHFVERGPAWYAERSRFFHHRLSAFLPADPGACILDAACGAGEALQYLRSRGYQNVLGIDLSEEQLAQARAAGITNVLHADLLEHLGAAAGRYDFIIASHVLEHFPKAQVVDCLRSMGRSLRAGGRMLVLTPNAGSPLGLPYSLGDFTHEVYFTAMSLAQVAAIADLSLVHLGGIAPDPTGFKGRIRRAVWDLAMGPALRAVLGDRRMKHGGVMEPELIGVFASGA